MPREHDIDQAFFPIAERFVNECLRQGSSLFSPARPAWSVDAVAELYERVVEKPDWSKGPDFSEKLRGQLDGAPADVPSSVSRSCMSCC